MTPRAGSQRKPVVIAAFVVFGVLSAVCFAYGTATSYVAQDDPPMSCDGASQEVSQRACMAALPPLGPMDPGQAAFGFSCIFGGLALVFLSRQRGSARLAAGVLGVAYIGAWTLLLVWNAQQRSGGIR